MLAREPLPHGKCGEPRYRGSGRYEGPCDAPAHWLTDPYMIEIYGLISMSWWCDNCHTERYMDT